MDEVNQVIEKLRQAADAIIDSGAIAPEGVTIDTHYPGGSSDRVYKRLKSRKAIFNGRRGKAKTRTFVGLADKTDWEERIRRRNRLKEIERVEVALQAIAEDPIWHWLR